MNDLERRLKNVLETDAAKAPRVPRSPSDLRKRVRRRQAGTVLVSIVAVVGVVGASIAGLRAIGGEDRADVVVDDPWAGYEVFERTASLHLFTVTSPSDWYLVNPASDPECLAHFNCEFHEVLQLSNFDPGLARSACGAPTPDGGVVLVIRIDMQRLGRTLDEPGFPVPIDPEGPPTDGPCGPGQYARFQVEGVPHLAWIGVGDGASQQDVAQLVRSFDGMSTHPTTEQAPDGDRLRAAYVIAGGENAAGAWRLEVRPSLSGTDPSNVEVVLLGAEGGQMVEGFDVPNVPIEQVGGDPTFGAVTKEASSVELRTDGVVEPARIVPLPPSMRSEFDLFFGSHEGDVPADAVPLDAGGRPLGSPYFLPPTMVTSDGNHVIARFDAFGSTWELSAPQHESGCSLRRIPDGLGGGGSCTVSTTSAGGADGHAFVYGTLPNKAVTANVVAVDGRVYPCLVVALAKSGQRYFVVAMEGPGPGELQHLDADGTVVRKHEVTWRDPDRPIAG